MKEYESFERIGVEPHRSYYIPFANSDKIRNKFGIIDRRSSSRFVSLDREWQIKQHKTSGLLWSMFLRLQGRPVQCGSVLL